MDWVEELFDGPFGESLKQTEEDLERTRREVGFITRELALAPADHVLERRRGRDSRRGPHCRFHRKGSPTGR